MEIIRLGADRFGEIKLLFRDVFMNEPWNDDWSDDIQLTEYLLDLTGSRNSLAFGLLDGDRLVGISLGSIMHWCTGTEYYIYEFCISRERQHEGLGTELLRGIEERVKDMGVDHIFLQTEESAPAYSFYKKNGFTELKGHVSLVHKL
ncbi:MAG: GNAT family N-acetyltransferase [Ruminococcus sp.]|nr:GNAT family N-acetyltransferase [Ruminococcus sp.]